MHFYTSTKILATWGLRVEIFYLNEVSTAEQFVYKKHWLSNGFKYSYLILIICKQLNVVQSFQADYLNYSSYLFTTSMF